MAKNADLTLNNNFLAVCKDMGVPMAKDKTFQPSQIMTFVGYELDTTLMEVRLHLSITF